MQCYPYGSYNAYKLLIFIIIVVVVGRSFSIRNIDSYHANGRNSENGKIGKTNAIIITKMGTVRKKNGKGNGRMLNEVECQMKPIKFA